MRRRRSHDGVAWRPPTIQDPKTGLYCRRCSRRHGYNGTDKLKTSYGKDGNQIVGHWLCPKSGDVLGEIIRMQVDDD